MSTLLFKRKRYGYGWTPVTLGGWVLVTLFIAFILLWSLIMLPSTKTVTLEQEVVFFTGLIIIITLMLLIIRRFAPRGKWRWGRKPTDNADEDF